MSFENVLDQVDASIHLKVAQSSSYHMAPFGAHFMAAVLDPMFGPPWKYTNSMYITPTFCFFKGCLMILKNWFYLMRQKFDTKGFY